MVAVVAALTFCNNEGSMNANLHSNYVELLNHLRGSHEYFRLYQAGT